MGSILLLHQTQSLFIIWAPDTDVTENSHGKYFLIAGHKKREK